MTDISVVIPIGPVDSSSVRRAVLSVMRQSVRAHEVILVDNGSGLDLHACVASLPVSIVSEPRRGAGYARNRGLQQVRSKHCAFLDSDDEWHESFLAEMAHAAARHPDAVLFVGSATVRRENGMLVRRPPFWPSAMLARVLVVRNFISTSATMVNVDRARAVGGFAEHLRLRAGAEDWALWLRLSQVGRIVAVSSAMAIRNETVSQGRTEVDGDFDQDLLACLEGAFGVDGFAQLPRRARAGLLTNRATRQLMMGRRSEARRGSIRAATTWPFSWNTLKWLSVTLLSKSTEDQIRGIYSAIARRRLPR